jgi:formate hydrogenlyase subunit 3/multisubunit Na+/H+ antiporter MnhD subunit
VDAAHRLRREHSGEALGLVQAFGRQLPSAAEGAEAKPFIAPVTTTWVWWQNSGLEFGIGSSVDGLAVLILALVAFIALLVMVFSVDYVRDDRRYTHFFAAITLFAGGMLIMVMAENMVQLILGWEIMGLTSFMLIGHWWEEEANSRAALKAFFTVRVGDVGPARRHGDHLLRRQPVGRRQSRLERVQHRRHPGVGAVGRGQHPVPAVGRGGAVHRLHR